MNEQRFGKEVGQYLNLGLNLSDRQIERLKVAREQALAKQRTAGLVLAPAVLTRAFGPVGVLGGGASPVVRWVLPVLILVAGVLGFQQWQASRDAGFDEADAIAEIDAEILKSDLPLGALIDAGFRHFVKGGDE